MDTRLPRVREADFVLIDILVLLISHWIYHIVAVVVVVVVVVVVALIDAMIKTLGILGGTYSVCLIIRERRRTLHWIYIKHDESTGVAQDWAKIILRNCF